MSISGISLLFSYYCCFLIYQTEWFDAVNCINLVISTFCLLLTCRILLTIMNFFRSWIHDWILGAKNSATFLEILFIVFSYLASSGVVGTAVMLRTVSVDRSFTMRRPQQMHLNSRVCSSNTNDFNSTLTVQVFSSTWLFNINYKLLATRLPSDSWESPYC